VVVVGQTSNLHTVSFYTFAVRMSLATSWSGHRRCAQTTYYQRNTLAYLCCLNIYYEKLSTMATQRDGTSKFLSQADSLAASLSDWIEDSTAAQTSAPHHRPFSPHPPPDFPSGTLRRRNNYSYNDGNGNSISDRAISSRERVISLRTSPRLLHEEVIAVVCACSIAQRVIHRKWWRYASFAVCCEAQRADDTAAAINFK
jgi:hypothetical protein